MALRKSRLRWDVPKWIKNLLPSIGTPLEQKTYKELVRNQRQFDYRTSLRPSPGQLDAEPSFTLEDGTQLSVLDDDDPRLQILRADGQHILGRQRWQK